MTYDNIVTGTFLKRPNRFIAYVEVKGDVKTCHVKNTGRCQELLVPGCTVVLEFHPKAKEMKRKTEYDLIAVYKGNLLINMDSQAPNRVFREWAQGGGFRPDLTLLRPETVWGGSRFDFYWQSPEQQGFVEVKGVTLEEGGVARFPDAPTLRGVKHLEELIRARAEGYQTAVCFLIQMEGMRWMEPNDVTHPEFGDALRRAAAAGVEVMALECRVTPDSLTALGPVPVQL